MKTIAKAVFDRELSMVSCWSLGIAAAFLPGIILMFFGIGIFTYLKFLGALALLVWIPGRSLIWLSGLRIPPLDTAVLAAALGMVTTTVMNKFSRWLQVEFVFYLWIIASLLYFGIRVIKSLPGRSRKKRLRLTFSGLGIGLIILLTLGMLIIDNYPMGVKTSEGIRQFNMHYYDGFYRNAVSRELAHSVPPQVPAAGDLPLGYHYGMDLLVSMFYRYFALDVFDLNHRLLLTFFWGLLILVLFVLIREMMDSEPAAVLGVFLIVFGSGGLAFLATWLRGVSQWGNIFYTFYFFNLTNVNSFLPGLAVLMGGFYSLTRWLRTRKFAWLLWAGLLLALAFEFKQFFLGPVLGALFLGGLITWWKLHDYGLFKAWLLTTALASPLVWAAYSHNVGGLPYRFRLHFVDWIIFSLQELDLTYLFLTWKGVIQHANITPLNILLLIPCLVIFFTGAYGLAITALPAVIKEFFSFRRIRPERYILAIFFGGCVLFFFSVQLLLAGRPRNYVIIYAFFLSYIVLLIFFAEKLSRFLARRKKGMRVILLSVVLVFSVMNTARFLYFKVHYPQPRIFSAEFLQISDWINNFTESEALFLHPPYLHYLCYFADRRVVLDDSSHSYITFHLRPRQIEARTADIQAFFQEPGFQGEILDKYGTDYIWTDISPPFKSEKGEPLQIIECYSDLGTQTIKKYQNSHRLELVFRNPDYLIYKIQAVPESQREVFLLTVEDGKKILTPFKKDSLP